MAAILSGGRLVNNTIIHKAQHAVSDLKLCEIHANRACNFLKFQAHLENSRPHKMILSIELLSTILKSDIVNDMDNKHPDIENSWILQSFPYGYS